MAMKSSYSFLALIFLCFYNISISKALNNGFSVEIIHRDSLRSPFFSSSETHYQRVANALRRSINRANHFKQASVSPNSADPSITPYDGEYLMTYSVGTPPFKQFGILDTGSDIIWLQCQPCIICYNQTTPIFDPSKSKTYKTLPCTSTTCQSVDKTSCSSHDDETCQYTINYGDGSFSQGDLSVDTLSLSSTDGSPIPVPRTVIGCGNSNTGTFHGKASGIVGLGGGPVSLITQLGSSIQGKFSYCLTPIFSQLSSKLNFGDAALVSGRGTVTTPIVPQDPKVFYYLTLNAFSVGNKKVEFGRSSSDSNAEGNIIIDSGTTLTILPENVYTNLESAVKDLVRLKRVEDPQHFLSLCYESTSAELDVPVITAHFSGADVKLNAINTFAQVADDVVCFAFIANGGDAIFGNLAQQNFLVGYDLDKKSVSFKPTDCTKE